MAGRANSTAASANSSAAASAAARKLSVLENRFLDALQTFPAESGATLPQLQPRLEGVELDALAKVVNLLLRKSCISASRPSPASPIVYRIVELAQQEKLGELEKDELLVYSFIKQVGAEGIWVRTLANRTNLHQNNLNRALKKLEQRLLVKTVKSVKLGNKKLYMLYELTPSAEVTGGVWFTDQQLDTDFVETVARACLRFISQRSYPRDAQSVFPPSYNGYPTLHKVAKFIRASKVSTVELSDADIEMVLNVLEFDARVERIPIPAVPLLMDEDEINAGYRRPKPKHKPKRRRNQESRGSAEELTRARKRARVNVRRDGNGNGNGNDDVDDVDVDDESDHREDDHEDDLDDDDDNNNDDNSNIDMLIGQGYEDDGESEDDGQWMYRAVRDPQGHALGARSVGGVPIVGVVSREITDCGAFGSNEKAHFERWLAASVAAATTASATVKSNPNANANSTPSEAGAYGNEYGDIM